ncbi:AraC family transcriptional regulator [Myroides odoratus]|uniref:helix-turn-helix domain-containing protein n=1 Tax=Myroides odoratus TaxID=256 RepID=UPI0033406E36
MKSKEGEKVKKKKQYVRNVLVVKLKLLICCLLFTCILLVKNTEKSYLVFLVFTMIVLVVKLTKEGIHQFRQSKQVSISDETASAYLKNESVILKPHVNTAVTAKAKTTVAEVHVLQNLLYVQVIDKQLFLDSTVTLTEVANILKVDKNKLIAYFKYSASSSFKLYINRLRVEHAFNIIREREKDITVEELTFLCGFNTRLSFYRAFVYFYGFAPSELLKN